MANSPLFHLLSRAVSLAETEAADSESKLSASPDPVRRAMLRGAALTAVTGMATGCGPNFWSCGQVAASDGEPKMIPGVSVAVVGGGLAGLTAAYRLQKAGIDVKVYEAKPRFGGRILSVREFFADGQVAELGGEFIGGNHRRMRSLAAELGLELDDLDQYRPELVRAIHWIDGQAYSERDVVNALQPFANRIREDRAALGLGLDSRFDAEYATALDQMSLDQYFDRLSIGGWLRSYLDTAMITEMGLETADQSAINFLANIAGSGDNINASVNSNRRFRVAGGTDRIIQALVHRLGDRVETGVAVDSVSIDQESGGYQLGLRRTNDLSDVTATHVVLAVPATMLRRMNLQLDLQAVTRQAIDGMRYGSSSKLLIGFNRRVWAQGRVSDGSSISDLRYQSVWDGSRLQPGPSAVMTSMVGGDRADELTRGTVQEQATATIKGLEKVFPGISRARVGMNHARLHWPTEHWVEGSNYCPGPGDWAKFRGAFSQPTGRLHFCGEHCSDAYSRTMEGACETGEKAAAGILNEVGVFEATESSGSCSGIA